MKTYTVFLLTISTLLCAGYTGRAQSDSVKVIPVQTYGLLVEDAVQRRVLDTLVIELTQQLSDMEQIQAQIEANLIRQVTILAAENQAREIIIANWESSYDVLEKQLGKRDKGNKWLKVAAVGAFVLGIFAGK